MTCTREDFVEDLEGFAEATTAMAFWWGPTATFLVAAWGKKCLTFPALVQLIMNYTSYITLFSLVLKYFFPNVPFYFVIFFSWRTSKEVGASYRLYLSSLRDAPLPGIAKCATK